MYGHDGIVASKSASVLRAAPVGSWAIAVCVCVDCLIYLYITARHCTLVPVHTRARLGGARAGEHKTNRTLTKGTLARAKAAHMYR